MRRMPSAATSTATQPKAIAIQSHLSRRGIFICDRCGAVKPRAEGSLLTVSPWVNGSRKGILRANFSLIRRASVCNACRDAMIPIADAPTKARTGDMVYRTIRQLYAKGEGPPSRSFRGRKPARRP